MVVRDRFHCKWLLFLKLSFNTPPSDDSSCSRDYWPNLTTVEESFDEMETHIYLLDAVKAALRAGCISRTHPYHIIIFIPVISNCVHDYHEKNCICISVDSGELISYTYIYVGALGKPKWTNCTSAAASCRLYDFLVDIITLKIHQYVYTYPDFSCSRPWRCEPGNSRQDLLPTMGNFPPLFEYMTSHRN